MICVIFFSSSSFLLATFTVNGAHTQKILQVADLWILTQAKTHILRGERTLEVKKEIVDDEDFI